MIKEKYKKYKGLFVIAIGMLFNIITSVIFAESGVPFNKEPLSTGEWVCDYISILIIILGAMMISYDILSYKPKKTITYKRVNGEIVEIIEQQ